MTHLSDCVVPDTRPIFIYDLFRVKLPHVAPQTSRILERVGLLAVVTDNEQICAVGLYVLAEGGVLRKALATGRTHPRPLSCVCVHVFFVVPVPQESHLAVLALMNVLVLVFKVDVFPKVASLFEPAITIAALQLLA